MNFEFPISLQNNFIHIRALTIDDFDVLYDVASDPLIWEQHPNSDRYKKNIFEIFFKEAIESKTAYLVLNAKTGKAIGSSRYYEYDADKKSIAIGWTFLARDHWSKIYNFALKSLMLNHAFKFVDTVIFHIGANNIRSQKATEKLGVRKIGELTSADGKQNISFVYGLEKEVWQSIKLTSLLM